MPANLKVPLALAALAIYSSCQAHPGNGIVVLADGSIITGDAVGSAVWQFRVDAPPKKLISDFHCHWVTLGRDGKVYGDLVEVRAGRWTTSFHRIDVPTRRATQVWSGTADASVFLVDTDSSIVRFDRGTLLAAKPGQAAVPFRGSGRAERGRSGPIMAKAMAWGPTGDVFLLERNRLWVAGKDGVLRLRATFPGRASGMYAGPNSQVQPWGLAVDSAGRAIVADPSRGVVVRVDQRGQSEVLARCLDGWAVVGVSVQGDRLILLESKTIGNRNFGPRVSVLDKDGRRRVIGTVSQ